MPPMGYAALLVAATGLGCILLSAQVRAPGSPASIALRPVPAAMIPERVVYEVFAAEVVGNDQQSKDARLTPEHRDHIARRLQHAVGLRDGEYAALKGVLHKLIADLDSNAREGDSVLKNVQLSPAERDAAIRALRDRRNFAVDHAIEQWREQIGMRFRFVDDRIREYIAPGLRISGTERLPR